MGGVRKKRITRRVGYAREADHVAQASPKGGATTGGKPPGVHPFAPGGAKPSAPPAAAAGPALRPHLQDVPAPVASHAIEGPVSEKPMLGGCFLGGTTIGGGLLEDCLLQDMAVSVASQAFEGPMLAEAVLGGGSLLGGGVGSQLPAAGEGSLAGMSAGSLPRTAPWDGPSQAAPAERRHDDTNAGPAAAPPGASIAQHADKPAELGLDSGVISGFSQRLAAAQRCADAAASAAMADAGAASSAERDARRRRRGFVAEAEAASVERERAAVAEAAAAAAEDFEAAGEAGAAADAAASRRVALLERARSAEAAAETAGGPCGQTWKILTII